MACSGDQSGSRRGTPDVDDEIEEGEFVSGYGYGTGSDTDTDDEDARYFLQPYPHYVAEDRPGVKQRRLEDIVAGVHRRDELPSSPPASSHGSPGSDGTISDGNVDAGVARVVLYPCPVCPREFGSKKAVHGHMRVHAQGKEKERPAVVVVSGGSVKEEVDGDSMAIVVAEPRLSMPVTRINQVVHGSSSAEPSHSASMAIVVAAAAPNPANEPAVVPPPPAAPQQAAVPPPPAAPQQAAVQPPAAAPQQAAVQPPAAAPPQQDVVHPPAAPQQAVVHPPAPPQQLVVPPPAPPQQLVVPELVAPQHVVVHPPDGPLHIIAHHDNDGFTCRECNRWFSTHQGLGGHVAGHKNRRAMREAAAAAAAAAASGVVGDAGAVACRGGPKPKKVHVCSKCGQVYPRGVSLGGHMRKHYNGTPIVPKKRRLGPAPAASVVEAPHQLVLTLSVQAAQEPLLAPPTIEAAQPAHAPAALEPAEPAPAPPVVEMAPQPAQAPPPVAGSVRIFGVTIVQPQEDSSDEH